MVVAVLMPAFNEQRTIGAVIAGLPELVHDRPVHVTVVDDGSTDATAEIARETRADVIVSDRNMGKGCALRRGVEAVRQHDPDAVVWMDSDGQHPPSALSSLTAPVIHGSADMVVGSRYLQTSHTKAPLNRRFVRWAVIKAIESMSGFRLTDPFSGFRCFSPAATEALELTGDRYECELEAFFSVAKAGLRIEEIAIPRIYPRHSSKMGYHRGRLLGRLDVLRGYAHTLLIHGSTRSIETRISANA